MTIALSAAKLKPEKRCTLTTEASKPVSTFLRRYPWLPIYLAVLVALVILGVLSFSVTPAEYQSANLTSDSWFEKVMEPWSHWDSIYYLNIAENWYQPQSAELSFPPLYSILVGLLGRILGGAYIPAALIISWVSLAVACGLLYQEFQTYTDPESSLRAIKYLLVFPTAFFLFAGYTESLFLVFLLLSWRGARRGIWWQAGLFGLLATMTRFIGIYLAFPYAWMWLQAPKKEKIKFAAWLAPIPVVFFGWIWLTERLYQMTPTESVLKFWYIKTDWPWVGLIGSIKELIANPDFLGNFQYADVASVFLFTAAIIWAARKKWIPEAIFMAVLMLTFLSKILVFDQLISTSRYVMTLFPGFVMLGEWGKRKWFNLSWTVISLLYMFYLSVFYFIGK